MIIFGIDPGLALMGYGIIEFERQKIKLIQYGCIETPGQIAHASAAAFYFWESIN